MWFHEGHKWDNDSFVLHWSVILQALKIPKEALGVSNVHVALGESIEIQPSAKA